jgi:uncharacterized membrane protein
MPSKSSIIKLLLILVISSLFTLVWAQTRTVSLSSEPGQVELLSNSDFGFNIRYSVGELQVGSQNTRGGDYDLVSIEGFGHTRRVGEPMLPISTRIISVPLGATPSVQILTQSKTTLSRAEARLSRVIMPAQESVSKSADITQIPFEFNEAAYSKNAFTANELFTIEEIGIMRGMRLFMISYEPLRYNPVEGSLELCLEAEIRVDFPGADLSATREAQAKTASFEFDQLFAKTIFNWNPSRSSLVSYPTKMLILCPPAYEGTMAPYIEFKRKQGYIVNLVTVGSGATVTNTTTAITAYMQGLWNAATAQDPAPTYLLIVGDTSTSGNNVIAPTGATGSHPSDLAYVRLNGTDYLPEMYFGRFSVTNTTELQNVINKTMMFAQTSMPDRSYLGKTVLIAGVDGTYASTHGNGAINYATAHYFNAANGITSNNYFYPASGSSDAQIIANAAEGRGYMNYTAHGGPTSWSDPTFTVTDMQNLTNTNKPFVAVGNCCVTNQFTTGECFGESIIRSANAGAAYIGGTNNTYWDEDYYWAVGYKTPINGSAPAYDPTKLGAYDAMFHAPSSVNDWAQTTGETVFMGNMAVQASTSTRKNYYWEIYSIMGDPSLMPYYGVPTVNTATFPPAIMLGLDAMSITAEPYSRVALSMNGTLHASEIVPASGSLTLNFTPFTSVGNADLVITRSGKITRQEVIQVLPASGPYMTVENNVYADSNNNLPDYNESGRFNTTFKNVGANSVSNVTATLSCSTPGITLTDATESIASLAAGASVTRTNAFAFNIANNIVNGTVAEFTITMVSGADTWEHNFSLVLNAPALAFGSFTVSDPGGNNNGRLDPGETVTITMPILNEGAAASLSGTATLTSPTAGITINTGSANFSAIAASGSRSVSFNLTASTSMSVGSIANLVFNATAGAYTASKNEAVAIGLILEDFESGSFDSYPWVLSGNLPWTITSEGAYEGTYAAKSGAITHNQSSSIATTRILTAPGTLRFRYKVASESGYDFLRFYVDDNQIAQYSGTVDWTEATYELAAGTRVLRWTYSKDGSVSSGEDCAWIDYIVFPASTSPSAFFPAQNLVANPGNHLVNLSWSAPASGTPTSYSVYRNGVQIVSVTGLSYQDTDVSNGTEYSYYIVAVYAGGVSEPSNTATATPDLLAEATIGTGTYSAAGSTANPLSIYYKSLHGQSVYTAAELAAAGVSGSVSITHVGFNVSQVPLYALPNFIIRMKHTSEPDVTNWQSADGMLLVYSNASYMPTVGGYELLPLSTPFQWNGVDNIVIDTAFGLADAWNGTGGVLTSSVPNGYRYGRSDSENQTGIFTGGSTSTNRPNIKLRFQGIVEEQAMITVSPTSLSFEDTIVGESSTATLRITNAGNIALTGSITTPTGFSINQRSGEVASKAERNTISINIAAGAFRDYVVVFAPTSAATYSGNIAISSNASNNDYLEIAVSGAGYVPPTINLNSGGVSASLLIGEEQSDSFTISNTGSQPLNFSISIDEARGQNPGFVKSNSSRSIAGSYLSVDPEAYIPGTTQDWEISVYNASTDSEWLEEIILTLPAGITINNAEEMIGGSEPMLSTIDGNTITWFGETSSGWGIIQGSQTGTATVNVSVPSSFTGDMSLDYTLNGDIYNAEPHTVSDVFVLSQGTAPISWLSLSATSGTLEPGASSLITASFSAVGMSEGVYSAMLNISSNDPANPSLLLEANMEVFDASNHPPVINLPASFSFDKNGSLQINIADYASDPDNDPLTLQIAGNTNIQHSISGLVVTLTATQNWLGSENLTFIVSDGELSTSDQALITVLPVNVPDWDVVNYPNNPATIYATVSIEGYPAMANDQVAAFVDGECRGITDIVLTRDTAHATIVVQLANPNETVYFRVYSYSTDTIYDAMVSVEPDFGEEIGSDTPLEIEAGLITSLQTPVVAIQQTGTIVQLSWQPVLHAQTYQVFFCSTPYGEFHYVGSTDIPAYPIDPNQTRGFYQVKALRGNPAK